VIVLDASAAIEFLLGTSLGSSVAARLARDAEDLHAPHLLDVEVTQALRRLQAAGEIDEERARGALEDFADLPLTRHGHRELLLRVWQLRRNATAYDGTYIALAEALEAPLLTSDGRLARVPGHAARVEVVRR